MVPLNIKLPKDFFNSETRSGFLVTEERKKVWAVELDLLCELDRICKKNGIKYLIDSGTLLGAVRHKGFIPWDDDIDLIMLREDYERLIKECIHEFKFPYFLQHYKNDEFFFRGHAQLRNSETCGALIHELTNVAFNQGIFIDIFPMDSVSDEWEKLHEQYDGLIDCLCNIEMARSKVHRSKDIISKTYNYYLKLVFLKYQRMYEKYAMMNNSVSGVSKYIDKIAFRGKLHSKFLLIDRGIFDKTKYMEFEFLSLPAPEEYDYLLKLYFGNDYMIPKQTPGCHAEIIFDVDKSYKDVVNDHISYY